MIRAAILAVSLLVAAPALAQDAADIMAAPEPEFVFEEAPTDRAYGDVNAPNTLILYASNVCPHCGEWFANEWQTVKSDLVASGKLRFVFRPLPSEPIQLSLTGFIFAECAPAEDYMAVIEDQFARQSSILKKVYEKTGDLREDYDAIAQTAGMENEAEITACLSNQVHMDTLQTSAARAGAAEISTIPAFIFDGQVMEGEHGADAIKGWIEGRSSVAN